jgi:shikimate kinase
VTPQLRQLILTGLPGSGKSTVGRALARRIGWVFVDLDDLVVERAGRSVEQIFEDLGEERFRELEAQATADLRDRDRLVTAPGGGWITRPEAVSILRPPARMAFLRVSPEVAAGRIARSGTVRPLVGTADPVGRIRELVAARGHLYATADLAVDTEVIVSEVVTQLEQWLVSQRLLP